MQSIQLVEQVLSGPVGYRTTKSQLWYGIVGHHNGYVNNGHKVREYQYAVLGNLRVGDAFHATQNRVDKYNYHPDYHTRIDVDLQKTREHDTNTAHLSCDISKRYKQRTGYGYHSGRAGVIAVSNEVGHSEFTEFAEVGR